MALCVGWLPAPACAPAQQPKEKTIAQWYEAAYVAGSRAGYVHTRVDEIDSDGFLSLRATVELRLTIRRNGQAVSLTMETGNHELA
ncbi:MAG: hypothetical protein NZO58_11220, partial [Gemmataceae bacterium]|nr:hypothetical protein [Gemmataceae bacterium]